jgi:hypothetical protein
MHAPTTLRFSVIMKTVCSATFGGRVLYLCVGQYRGDLVVFNTTLEVRF